MSKEIKVVASVDIDVFFRGHTYAKYMQHEVSPLLAWDIIEMIKKEDKNINTKPDIRAINKVIELLKAKCKKDVEIITINEHDEIIDVMDNYDCEGTIMYNFDAHHDCNYGNDNSELNLENWALHSMENGMVRYYNWICRPLSEVECNRSMVYTKTCVYDVNEQGIEDIDLLVICISHHFTPKKYWDTIPELIFKNLEEAK